MPNRHAYVGDPPTSRGTPMQPETLAFLSRFTTQPSAAWTTAFNNLVYRFKNAGILSNIQDWWILCGPNSADSLRNFVTASRDASIKAGAPVFTANKGWAVDSTDYLQLPFTGTPTIACFQLYAGIMPASLPANGLLCGCSNASSSAYPPALNYNNGKIGIGCGSTAITVSGNSPFILTGAGPSSPIYADGSGSLSSGSFSAAGTGPLLTNGSIGQLSMVMLGTGGVPGGSVAKIYRYVAMFLDEINLM